MVKLQKNWLTVWLVMVKNYLDLTLMNLFFQKILKNHSPCFDCIGFKTVSGVARLVTTIKDGTTK